MLYLSVGLHNFMSTNRDLYESYTYIRVKSKFSTNNFKQIRIPQFSETRFGSFVGLFLCFDVYKQ